MAFYSVGKIYVPGRTQWPETTDVDMRGGELVLRLFYKNVRTADVKIVKRAPVDVAITIVNGLAFLLYRFRGATGWSDQPVSYRQIAPPDRQLPPEVETGQFLLCQIHLVDADTGMLRAIRVFSVGSQFAAAWRAALEGDLALAPWPSYDQQINAAYAQFPKPDDLLRLSLVTENGNPARF